MTPKAADFLAVTAQLVPAEAARPLSTPRQIAAALRQRIQFGELRPGDPIREIPLASEFDVSRGPVRDAFKILALERLIALGRNTGAVVRTMSADDLRSIFNIRAELFALTLRLAAEKPDRDERRVAAFARGAEALAAVAADPHATVADYIVVRRRLADLLHAMVARPYLARLSAELESEVALLWASILSKPRQARSSIAWGRVAAALGTRDAPAASAEGRDLVLASLEELLRQAQEAPTPPVRRSS